MTFKNPYRPGAGHRPPHLAGRVNEISEFNKLLEQDDILENMVLTGLRGVGKTVLMEEFKPIASKAGWIWVGSDLSETTSVSEKNLAIRILTDISIVTSSITISQNKRPAFGFTAEEEVQDVKLNFPILNQIYEATPGLVMDKLKGTLEFIHSILPPDRKRVVFAYDEAQNLSDNAAKDEYPLSVLLDVFQSLQRKGIPFMLALAGLPTLFPKLVDARTYAERMFRVLFLDQLSQSDSKDAILKPLDHVDCPLRPDQESVDMIVNQSGGYPYFIQFICREIFDIFLHNSDGEFSVQDVVLASKNEEKPFSSSQTNQMFSTLCDRGLIYKNRHGKYSFAVPLLGDFIRRSQAF